MTKRILALALALAALTSTAFAEQVELTDQQMDKVTAAGPAADIRFRGVEEVALSSFRAAPTAVAVDELTQARARLVAAAFPNGRRLGDDVIDTTSSCCR